MRFLCGPSYLNSLLDQPGLELRDPPAFVSPILVLGLKACYTSPAVGLPGFKSPYSSIIGIIKDAEGHRLELRAHRLGVGGFPHAWPGALASMGAAIKLFALFPCLRSRRRMGTAEQNRASGQRGQRAGIPFTAGRAKGRVSSPSDVRRVPTPRSASRPQRWGDKGTGNRAEGSGMPLVQEDQQPGMNLKNPECSVRPALSTPCTRTHDTRRGTKSLSLLLHSLGYITDLDRSLSGRQSWIDGSRGLWELGWPSRM